MFASKKIVKEKGADPEPFELDVAQALCDLEANSNDLKAELRELYITHAQEVDVTGRKAVVIFVPFKDGMPSGKPQDILTGFLSDRGEARGRPVGVTIDKQGALLVADDVGNAVWRVTPAAKSAAR